MSLFRSGTTDRDGEFDRFDVLWAAVAAIAVNLVGAIGVPFTTPDSVWFQELTKPWFYPPDWAFGVVWPILYALLGVAAYLVWRRRGTEPVRLALGLFVLQLAVNVSWSPIFFGLEAPGAALVVIVVLWLLVLATVAAFARVDVRAAALLVPYVAWVSFAAVLNYAIWTLNV